MTGIESRMARLRARVRTRNSCEYASLAVVALATGWIASFIPDPTVAIGALMIAGASLFVAVQIFSRMRLLETMQGAPIAAYRRTLLRQHDALSSMWKWYLLPFAPGAIVFVLSVAFSPIAALPLHESFDLAARGLGLAAFVMVAAWLINKEAAARIQMELDSLHP